jgi:hypothetical protein
VRGRPAFTRSEGFASRPVGEFVSVHR